MFHKPFDRASYAANNKKGIDTALELLGQHGYKTIDDGAVEAYSAHDCIVARDDDRVAVEVERKLVWRKKDAWEGYGTVRVPYRKRASKAELYIMINEASTCALVCRMGDVKAAPVQDVYTQLCGVEEPFFHVPIERFSVYVKRGSTWASKHGSVL
jgi:hypothetical protein